MSSTKKFLKATAYAGTAVIVGSLAQTQQNNIELFTIFTLATGIMVAGASCCVIAGVETYKEEKVRQKRRSQLADDNNKPEPPL